MKKTKRSLALLLVLTLLMSCFAGCGKGTEPVLEVTGGVNPEGTQPTAAMGRYVEKDFPLPEESYAMDMVMLENGALRVAVGNVEIYTTDPERKTWEHTMTLPDAVLQSGNLETVSLSPKGDIFCSTIQENGEEGTFESHLWIIGSSGEVREIPLTYPEIDNQAGYLLYDADFTDSGKLLGTFYVQDTREINTETGELSENLNILGEVLEKIACVGEDAYLLGYSGEHVSLCHEGSTEVLSGTLADQLTASLQATSGRSSKVAMCQNSDGYIFFTTHEGLYSYIPGGSVTEELVSGTRSSLGDPMFVPVAIAGTEDGSFYVLGNADGVATVYHYVYDPSVPTEPETILRVYSLYDDENLRQMISQYQKANPNVAIDFEVGLTGEDGVTIADAIRTLNTEILAGSGPDILELDGFSLDTFIEKDLLMDLSAALKEPLLEQVTHCYRAGGKLCAVPTTFSLPVMYGPGHIVSQMQDLDSLVAAATQAKAEYPDAQRVFVGFHPLMHADAFYDSCSAAWLKPDGSLDEEKLTAYYAGMKALYDLDAEFRQGMGERVAEAERMPYTPGAYTGVGGAISVILSKQILIPGTLNGMKQWEFALAGDDQLEGYEMTVINAQASNVFLPKRIMGVLSTSTHQELAAQFIAYMLSEEVQAKTLSDGFPVNRAAFDRKITEDGTSDYQGSYSDGETEVTFYGQYPDARRRQDLKGWVDKLTTPALTNQTIRNMVMDQMTACLKGEITPQEAAGAALKSLNLYLSE